MVATIVGYIGALVASVFFGSNYVPTKNYPTGDGMAFVWVFASGVMSVGIVSMFLQHHDVNEVTFVYSGILGGCLWATGNLCVVPIIKMIGLGLGMIIWGSTSLITGFFFAGKFGLWGLPIQEVPHPTMNWAGIIAIILALGVFFMVKPTLDDHKSEGFEPIEEAASINGNDRQHSTNSETSIFDRIPTQFRYILGAGLAVFSGMMYGLNTVPMKVWSQNYHDDWDIDFVFSHFTGIYIFSTVIFLGYCIVVRPPQIFPQSILPSFISGAMWGIAQVGLMIAVGILGYTVGFPIASTGPIIVSSLWSVLYFREIRGTRNFMFLGASFALLILGISLLTKSSIA